MAPRPERPPTGRKARRTRPATPEAEPAASAESESGVQQQSLRSDRARDHSTQPSQSHQQSSQSAQRRQVSTQEASQVPSTQGRRPSVPSSQDRGKSVLPSQDRGKAVMHSEDRGKSVHPTRSQQIGVDWDEAQRLAADEGLTQEDIQAAIQAAAAAKRARRTHTVHPVREGSGSVSAGPAVALQLAGAESHPVVPLSTQAEELRRREQVKTFTRMGAPWFDGQGTAMVAEGWLRQARKVMDTMGVGEDSDRVRLATFHLTDIADDWWTELTRTRQPETFSWKEFVTVFYVRFFPRATRLEYADRFASLVQADRMSVSDYYTKFIQLAKFAPLAGIPDEATRAHRFQRGLKLEYKPFMAMLQGETLELVRDAALKLEKGSGELSRRTEYRARHSTDSRPGKRQQQQYHQPAATAPPLFAALPAAGSSAASHLPPKPPSSAQQSRPVPTCYYCQEVGHMRPQCPHLRQ